MYDDIVIHSELLGPMKVLSVLLFVILCTNRGNTERVLCGRSIMNSGLQKNVTEIPDWLSREGFSVTLASIQKERDVSDDSQRTTSTTPSLTERKART
jgi:hypothetical protein